jgi:endonuclease-3
MRKKDIYGFFSTLRALDPEPRGELVYNNNFTLLVAVVLSAQATDISVNKATKGLFKAAYTPKKMLALGHNRVKDCIKTIGLFNSKAKNIMGLSKILAEDFNSTVPNDRSSLESLPGVGRKTANVVLNVAFGEVTCAVDTHIFRIGNRTGMAKGKTPLEVEKKLMSVIPKEFGQHAHNWLILQGRHICKARKPDCTKCPVLKFCGFKGKTKP